MDKLQVLTHMTKKKIQSFFFYIQNQLLILILLIFVFFSIISISIIAAYDHMITDKIHTITESYTATISSSLTLLEENTRETAALLKNSRDVQTALSANVYDTTSVFKYNQSIRSVIVNVMHVNRSINMIYIGNDEYNYYYNINSSSDGFSHTAITELLSVYKSDELFSGVWITGKSIGIAEHVTSLFFVQKIRNLNTISPIGYVIIEVDSSFLDEAINSTAFETDTTIAFIKDHDLLYKNSLDFSEENLIRINQKGSDHSPNNDFLETTIDGHKYFITTNYNEALELSILSLISYQSLMGDALDLQLIIIFLVILFILLLLFIALRFSKRIVKQVLLIKNIFNNNLAIHLSPAKQPFHNDEIGQIGKECEMLLYKYNDSVKQTYELNIKQKESELLRLQEQINPHFLYNTLDSIFWMCESNGNHDAAQMSLYLSRYFRSNIGKDELTITIREEISSIQNYLAIQNIRYQDKFKFVLHVDESLYNVKILRMLIQPLIENSIFHGLEPKNGVGIIDLSVRQNNKVLTIVVKDDGVGFQIQNLKKGLALKNVDERVKLFYGESYGLEITSQPSIGTVVTIKIFQED